MSISPTLVLCVCAFNRLSVSYDIEAQGEGIFYCLVLHSCKHCQHEAPHKLACNSLTYSSVYIYRVAPDRFVDFIFFLNIITPSGKKIG